MIEQEYLCPWCNEPVVTSLDPSVPNQVYTEDCTVCCRPVVISYNILDDGGINFKAIPE